MKILTKHAVVRTQNQVAFSSSLIWSFVFCIMALLPEAAFASTATTLGAVVCNAQLNLVPYADFISAVAYVAGAMFIGNGLIMFKQHGENPNQAPMSRCVMMLVGGGACLAAPEVAYLVQQSLWGSTAAGSLASCSPGNITNVTSGSSGLDTIFANLFNNIAQPMQTLLSGMSLVIGSFFVAKGLMKAAKYGTDARAASVQAIMANLVVGAILLAVGQMTDVIMTSLFGITSSQITSFPTINWSNISSSTTSEGLEKVNAVVKSVLLFVQVIGMISFLRGWMIVKAVAEGSGQATMAQGITHIVGGVMAINIGGMATIFNATFGLNILNAT